MARKLLYFALILLIFTTVKAAFDEEVEKKGIEDKLPVLSAILENLFLPKECVYYTKLSSPNRSMNYKSPNGDALCDAKLTSGWYRFTESAGSHMATTCVAQDHCTAVNPGWLNGNHPSIRDGQVKRKVCFHSEGKCCYASVNIRVTNCGPFYVYYMNGVPCPFRYCGGHVSPKPTTSLPTTAVVTTEIKEITTAEPSTTTLPPFPTEPEETTTAEPSTTTLPPFPTEPEETTTAEPTTLRPFPIEPVNTTTAEPNKTTLRPSFPSPLGLDECFHYKTLEEQDRAMSFYNPSVVSGDFNLPTDWYRFTKGAGTKMAEQCVGLFHCGTHAPGWLLGGHPTNASEHAVQREVCFHWANNCCYFKGRILVRQCKDFFIYKLRKIHFKYLRYCGNDSTVSNVVDV